MQPVWVLSVDLQTKTATFQSGMADAARSARTAFQDIGTSARSGSKVVEEGTIDVRHSLGALDNTIRGNHAAAMTDFIRLFQNSSVVMAALPFAAPIAGFLLLSGTVVEGIKALRAMGEAKEKLSNEMEGFRTTVNEAFGGLDQKIRQAAERADELRNDHLGALRLKLEDIDHASMNELVKSLETVAKASDEVFKSLEGNWYTLGIGSAGASHALGQFKIQYDNLLSQGNDKDKDASDLLHGTLESAKHILALQQQMVSFGGGHTSMSQAQLDTTWTANRNELKKAGVGYTQKEVAAQQQLVDLLNAQVTAEGKIAELKKLDQGNAKTETSNGAAALRSAAAKEHAESQTRMGQSALAADKATSDARLALQRASVEARLDSDLDFAGRQYQLQLAGNQREIAALDKSGKDYANQLQALRDKALEIDRQYETQVAEMQAKASIESGQRDLQNLEQSEREKIEATQQGSAARLAAIDAAIKEEQSKNLQDTNFYRELLTSRVELIRSMAADEAKDKAAAGKEAADNDQKMGELRIAAERQAGESTISQALMTGRDKIQLATDLANQEYQTQRTAINRELAALDTEGKDYENKKQALNDRLAELQQSHENQMAQIQQQAASQQGSFLTSSMTRMIQDYAHGFSDVLMGKQSFGRMMGQIDSQIVGTMLQTAIMSAMTADFGKEKEAAAAARKMFLAGTKFPFPANIVMAPALGAMAFASVMAFEAGGVVPGVGRGDTVPALLTPGEGVVPKGVMDGLSNMARSGSMGGGGNQIHVHLRPTYHVNTIDGDGMQAALDKHTDVLQRHFERTLRKMNH